MTTSQSSKYAIAIVSGGLDSTTMVYDLLANEYKVDMVSFDYGQRHRKELVFARATAQQLGLRHDIIDLSGLTHLISNSALTSQPDARMEAAKAAGMLVPDGYHNNIEVPDGHYAEENMKLTVVPNRNMIMLSIATGISINRQATTVATAVHAGDHFIYPDCRPQFIGALGQAILIGNEGFHNFLVDLNPNDFTDNEMIAAGATHKAEPILAPYYASTKADIAYRALLLKVPFHMTWSCYKGGTNHCGRCGTCVERLEAIDEAGRRATAEFGFAALRDGIAPEFADHTMYDDTEFWKQAVRAAAQ